jgi:hypothetical protein
MAAWGDVPAVRAQDALIRVGKLINSIAFSTDFPDARFFGAPASLIQNRNKSMPFIGVRRASLPSEEK